MTRRLLLKAVALVAIGAALIAQPDVAQASSAGCTVCGLDECPEDLVAYCSTACDYDHGGICGSGGEPCSGQLTVICGSGS